MSEPIPQDVVADKPGHRNDRVRHRDRPGLAVAPWLILALIPVLSAARAIRGRWTPVSDWAMIGAWSTDSFTWPPPLVGMPTSLSQHTDQTVSHPGPLLFWALALPTRLFGAPGYGIVIGSAAINLVFLALIAYGLRAVERHFADGHLTASTAPAHTSTETDGPRVPWLTLAGAIGVGIMMMSLGGEAWRDPYNPIIAILPLLATLVAAWAVICGQHRWLLAVIGAGSFAAQAHTSYLPVVGLVLVVLGTYFAVGVFAGANSKADTDTNAGSDTAADGRQGADGWPSPAARPSAKVLVGSLMLGLALWAGPLIDQFFGSGNLWRLVAGGTESQERLGFQYGLERLVGSVGVPPWWASEIPEGQLGHLGTFRLATGAAVLAVLVWLLVMAWRRDRTVTWSLAVALVAGIGGVVASALIPVDPFSVASVNNRYLWVPIGLYLWLAVGHAVARLLVVPALARREPSLPKVAFTTASVVATLTVVGLAAGAVAVSGPKHAAGSAFYGALRQHSQAIADLDAPNGFSVMIDSAELQNALALQGLLGQMAFRGIHIGIPDDLDDPYGVFTSYQRRHEPTGREDAVILVRTGDGADQPPPGFCQISRYDPADPWPRYEGFDEPILFSGLAPTAIFVGPIDRQGAAVDDSPSELCDQADAN